MKGLGKMPGCSPDVTGADQARHTDTHRGAVLDQRHGEDPRCSPDVTGSDQACHTDTHRGAVLDPRCSPVSRGCRLPRKPVVTGSGHAPFSQWGGSPQVGVKSEDSGM